MSSLRTLGTLTREARDRLLHAHLRRQTARAWRQRHRRVFSKHPELALPLPRAIEAEHREFWRPLAPRISLDTLRLCSALSGRPDPQIVPEEVFAGLIERCLSPPEWTTPLSHKSLAPLFLRAGLFPDSLLHSLGGDLFDATGCPVDRSSLSTIVERWTYPVVIKPNTGSAGGRAVAFCGDAIGLLDEVSRRRDFIVQPVQRQHPYFAAFNAAGLNTVRVYTYRSVSTGKVEVLNAAMRMGRGGSLDNETAGGIVCYLSPDGHLNHYALDKHAGRFKKHPDSGIVFATAEPIPKAASLFRRAQELGARLALMRLAGWDFYLDEDGEWRCLELNLGWHTIRFAQYAGRPFFGRFAQEVRDYCASHPLARRAMWMVA